MENARMDSMPDAVNGKFFIKSRDMIFSLMGLPLPVTMDRETKNQWHVRRGAELSVAEGVSVTVSCKDVEGAMKFINDLLDEEILICAGCERVSYCIWVQELCRYAGNQR